MSGLELKTTAVEQTIRLGDDSGYCFTIRAALDDEWGWRGEVQITSFGMKTSEDAVDALRAPAEHFLRMLNESRGARASSPAEERGE